MPLSARAHLLVSILSMYRKRAHSPSSKDEHSIGLKDSLLAHSSDPVEMRRLNYQTPGREQQNPLFPTCPDSQCQIPTPEGESQSCSPRDKELPAAPIAARAVLGPSDGHCWFQWTLFR